MTISDAILLGSAAAQRAALDRGELRAVDLTYAYLKRIEAIDGDLRGFVHVDPVTALKQAQDADQRLQAGERSPVLGLAFGVKDVIDVGGMPTTYGSRAFADNMAAEDAGAVARIRQAGGVILGKTNTFEFALVMPSPLHRESRNPWDRYRVTGGSSNGSATAVSAGLCSIALGSDTSGSIRNPAAYCGVTGLKPTHGRVSLHGVGVLASSMDTVGPMARSVDDCALAMQVLAAHDPADARSAERAADDYLRSAVAGELVIGVPDSWFPDLHDLETDENWRAALRQLQEIGVRARPVSLPPLDRLTELWAEIAAPEALEWHESSLMARRDAYGPAPLAVLDRLKGLNGIVHVRARRDAFELRRAVEAAMAGVDVLVVPTTPVTAFTFDEARTDRIACGGRAIDSGTATVGFTRLFSITGQPALAVPSGVAANGMPLSLQVAARHFDEAKVLAVGRMIESVCRFSVTPPLFRMAADPC